MVYFSLCLIHVRSFASLTRFSEAKKGVVMSWIFFNINKHPYWGTILYWDTTTTTTTTTINDVCITSNVLLCNSKEMDQASFSRIYKSLPAFEAESDHITENVQIVLPILTY